MGTLKPNATYVYERVGNITYAREIGADPSTRVEIGRGFDPNLESTVFGMPVSQLAPWVDILREAENNPTLQTELDRVIMLYHLIKEEKPIFHHSV